MAASVAYLDFACIGKSRRLALQRCTVVRNNFVIYSAEYHQEAHHLLVLPSRFPLTSALDILAFGGRAAHIRSVDSSKWGEGGGSRRPAVQFVLAPLAEEQWAGDGEVGDASCVVAPL